MSVIKIKIYEGERVKLLAGFAQNATVIIKIYNQLTLALFLNYNI